MSRSWTAIIRLSSELFLDDEFESSEIDFSFRIDEELELFRVDLGGFAGAFIDELRSKLFRELFRSRLLPFIWVPLFTDDESDWLAFVDLELLEFSLCFKFIFGPMILFSSHFWLSSSSICSRSSWRNNLTLYSGFIILIITQKTKDSSNHKPKPNLNGYKLGQLQPNFNQRNLQYDSYKP